MNAEDEYFEWFMGIPCSSVSSLWLTMSQSEMPKYDWWVLGSGSTQYIILVNWELSAPALVWNEVWSMKCEGLVVVDYPNNKLKATIQCFNHE